MARMTPKFKKPPPVRASKGRSLTSLIPMDTSAVRIQRATSIRPPRRTVSMPRTRISSGRGGGGGRVTVRRKKVRKVTKSTSRRLTR